MFNVFHQRKDPSIVCVIPDVGIMPTFLREEGWRYGGRTDRVKGVLSEFDHAAAKAVIQRTGFYVYAEQ